MSSYAARMGTGADIPIGERIRFYRGKRSQVVIAGLAGITERYLSLIERGQKTPTIATLHRIARALGVSVTLLLGEPAASGGEGGIVHPVAGRIQAAMMSYGPALGREPVSVPELRARVNAAWAAWQGAPCRYTELATVLPDLTADVQHAYQAGRGDRDAARLAADLNFLLRTFCKRIGRPDLSLLAADRAIQASCDADDPVRIAAAQWNLAQILISAGEADGALEVSRSGVEKLRAALPPSVDATAVTGALWLTAAVASVRLGDAWAARDILRDHAQPAADATGETNALWTVFGPANVQLHALSVEMEAGEAAAALRMADRIDVSNSPSLERRTTFYLEVARCFEQQHQDPAVLVHLQAAELTGPEDLRYNLLARDLVRGLLKRSRATMRPQVAGLASRIGLVEN